MTKTKIIVCGAAGRMGSSIARLAREGQGFEVTGALERPGHPSVGSVLSGSVKISDDLSKIIALGDVVIDFTAPAATLANVECAQEQGAAMVIGTTGLSAGDIEKIAKAGSRIPIVLSSNMSIGINILFRLAGEVAAIVPQYDVEILELHHNQKKDAPSGTAMTLAKGVADALGRSIDEVGVYGRHGITGARKKEEIGVLAVRGGDIVGEHTVYYVGPGERIELTHRAQSRDTLASGALTAAQWIVRQKPGVYDMQDVLGLKNS